MFGPRKISAPAGLIALVALCTSASTAADWTRFRGPNGTGISDLQGLPRTWATDDYEWIVDLPGDGHSSPVIADGRLYVTSAEERGARRTLYAIDSSTGKQLWSRTIGMNQNHKHLKSSWASATPTTDGQLVYVAFADREHLTLACYTRDGELSWRRILGEFDSQHGHGVSPILFEDLVILPNDQKGPSSVMAFDRHTGRTRWSVLRAVRKTSYATPLILEQPDAAPQLICLSGATGLSSLDPRTGQVHWQTGEMPMRTVASPVAVGDLLIATCGGGGVGKLLLAAEQDGSGIRYERSRILPYVPTPVASGEHVFLWNDNGVVSCVEAASGKNVWTERVGGNYSGSPVCVDGTLYCMSEAGEVVVMDASPTYHLYGRMDLGDPSHATPAVADGRLYLRTFHRLFCLAAD